MTSVYQLLVVFLLCCNSLQAAEIFVPRELFRIPFGAAKEELGSKIENDHLHIPSDFTIDGVGRFYINDIVKHRVVRYSAFGKYELAYTYPATAKQVFAHADEKGNLWLLISDPKRGVYYGVHDAQGKQLRSAIFSQFNRFRLHVGDDAYARVILSSDKNTEEHLYRFEPDTLLMKRDPAGIPSQTHHRLQAEGGTYFIDQNPQSAKQSEPVQTVTDESRRPVGKIEGRMVYATDAGEVYTRIGRREIRIYSVKGKLKGRVILRGLSSSVATVRFDTLGSLYQLDGIPDRTDADLRVGDAKDDPRTDREDLYYTSNIPGMRLVAWTRERT